MTSASVHTASIIKFDNGKGNSMDDLVAVEEPLEIRIGYGPEDNRQQQSLSVTMRTPGNDLELASGFLFTEGLIQSAADILRIDHCWNAGQQENPENIVRAELSPETDFEPSKLKRNFYTSSSCGVCGKTSIDSVKSVSCFAPSSNISALDHDVILRLPINLRQQQLIFKHTGGLHAVALFNLEGELLIVREDVGRHNAMDKVVGASLLKGTLPLSKHILLLSGRASFELIQKAAMAGIEVVAAVGAPSSLAIELAKESGITLIGFLRENHFNVYTNPERLKTAKNPVTSL